MTPSEQLTITKQQIDKAAEICRQVGQMFKAEKGQNLEKADPTEGFYATPVNTILSEEALQNAPEAIIALAAFIGQGFEGLQNAIKVLNDKLDFIASKYAESTEAVLKSQTQTLDLVKASLEVPAESFKAPAAFVPNQPQQPSMQNLSKAQIVEELEQLVELKKATPQDIALFESSGRLSSYLMDEIKSQISKRKQ